MRCLIVIALCFVLANANYQTKNRFQRLLRNYQNQDRYENEGRFEDQDQDQDQDRYQKQYRHRYQSQDRLGNELYGSDDTDDYIDDYVDEIRRERRFERDQCPRDIDEIEGQFRRENQYDDQEDEDDEEMRGGRYSHEYEREGRRGGHRYSQYDDEEESRTTSIRRSPLLQEVEDANVKLAARLYKQSKDEKDDKNTVVSPLSVQLALAALNSGARGNTKRQIGRVIGGRLQKQQRKQIFKQLIRHLKGLRQNDYSSPRQQTKINPVTGIFVTKTTRPQQMFIQQVKRNLGANVHQCNFQRQPQQCRQTINRFVAQKTQGKITHIVPQDAITDNTKMILVNALQLKAPWGRQVRQHINTKETKFYPLDTKKVKHVEVIETEGRYKYYEDELVKIVGLPTEKKQMTLYVIVPKDKDGLTDVEKLHLQDGVQLKQLLDVTDQRPRRHVGVQLPKFQIKHKIDVRRTLRKQGVTDAFDVQRADFSGITGGIDSQYEDDERDQTPRQRRDPFSQYEDEYTSQRRNPFLNSRYEEDESMEYQGQHEQREHKLHLNKFIHQTTLKITEQGITATTGSQSPFEREDDETERPYGRQGRRHHRGGEYETDEEMNSFDEITGFNRREPTGQHTVKANRAFAFVLKHNPTNQLVMVGRVIDAAQKKVNDVHQTINNVDQL
jgi:serine protease inhibitor